MSGREVLAEIQREGTKFTAPVKLPGLGKDLEPKPQLNRDEITGLVAILAPEFKKLCTCGNKFNHVYKPEDWSRYEAFKFNCSNPKCEVGKLLIIYSRNPLNYEIINSKKTKIGY